MLISELLALSTQEIHRLRTELLDREEVNNNLKQWVSSYFSEKMHINSTEISALLPKDMTSIFSVTPSNFDENSIFFYQGNDAEKTFALQLLYQLIRQGTYDLAEDQLSYLPFLKCLSKGTKFEDLSCGPNNYIFRHTKTTHLKRFEILFNPHVERAYKEDCVKQEGILEQLTNHFRALAVNPMHNYRPHYHSFFEEEIDIRNIGPEFSLNNIQYIYRDDPSLSQKIDQIIDHGNVMIKKIRGDGNCYYRSVMYKILQDIVLSTGETRQELLNNFAVQIKKVGSLIKNTTDEQWSNLFSEDQGRRRSKMSALIMHNTLINMLYSAQTGACWNTLNELDEDLLSDTLDCALILAAKFLIKSRLIELQNTLYNGLSLKDSIEISYNLPLDSYIEDLVMKDTVYAEGSHVNLSLLPAIFGYDCTIVVLPREEESRIALIQTYAHQGREMRLLLRPGHYDVLISHDEWDRINQHRKSFYQTNIDLGLENAQLNSILSCKKDDRLVSNEMTDASQSSAAVLVPRLYISKMQEALLTLEINETNCLSLSPLFKALIKHGEHFFEDNDVSKYIINCKSSLKCYKHEINKEQAPKNFLQYISETFRKLFHLIDLLVSKVTQKETMANTYNPLARVLVGRDHFFLKPELTAISHAIESFNFSLNALKEAHLSSSKGLSQ